MKFDNFSDAQPEHLGASTAKAASNIMMKSQSINRLSQYEKEQQLIEEKVIIEN